MKAEIIRFINVLLLTPYSITNTKCVRRSLVLKKKGKIASTETNPNTPHINMAARAANMNVEICYDPT